MGWKVWESNTGEGEIFRARLDRPWGLYIVLYNEYRVSFLGVNQLLRGVDYPHSSRSKVKESVDLKVYFLCGVSRPLLGSI